MLTFKAYIFLIEATGEQLYKQVYGKKIPLETFYKIVSGDIERVEDKNIAKDLGYDKVQDYLWKNIPQTQFNGEYISNVGTKAKWTLDLWLNDEFEPSEDTLRDIYNAYTTYNVTKSKKLKNTPFENFRKVESIKSVSDLMKIDRYIKNNINSTKKTTMTDSANDIDIIFENEEWKVLVPLTYRSSKLYGLQKCKSTWCTASSSSMFYYNKYMATNDLYIFFNKEDPTESSFQMGFHEGDEDPEFRDNSNISYDLGIFIEDNDELEPTIQEILDEWNKIDGDDDYKQKKMFERFKRTKSPNIPYNMIEQNGNLEIIKKMLKYLPKNMLRQKILIDEVEEDGSMVKKWGTFLTIASINNNEEILNFLSEYADIKLDKYNINDIPLYTTHWNNKRMDLGIPQEQIKKEMIQQLKEHEIRKYKILDDFKIDVDWDVYINHTNIGLIPFTFNNVSGNFMCQSANLKTLENCPIEVGGSFKCYDNYLTSLKGAPSKIGGNFSCGYTDIMSLKYSPKEVGGYFNCSNAELRSLEGCPKELNEGFDCSDNYLQSLVGGPLIVGGDFDCSNNGLKTLEGAPNKIDGMFLHKGNLRISKDMIQKYNKSIGKD